MPLMIDSHQHFWSLRDPWFSWPTPDLAAIFRDFGPQDLAPHLKSAGIARTVLVQVAPTSAETDYLLAIAERTDFVGGVVGWVDLETQRGLAELERFAQRRKFVGVRPMIQSIPAVEWMLQPHLRNALAALQALNLSFDALVFPKHLSSLAIFADLYPNLRIVVDHGAKPAIRDSRAGYDAWAGPMAALAERPNVTCKLSGLLTEAGNRSTAEDLAPFIDHLLETFGPGRLMWGSDWPVVELAGSYQGWLDLARRQLSRLSRGEQDSIFGEVARGFYNLGPEGFERVDR